MKSYVHCGTTYKIKERVARYVMECGTIHTIYSSNKKFKGIPLFLMFTKCKGNKQRLTKITDAYSFWCYWATSFRQAWIVTRQDAKLWTATRKEIEMHQSKMKNKDVLPGVCW